MSIFYTDPQRSNGDRSVKLSWQLGDTTDAHGSPAVATAMLHVMHSPNSKAYSATLSRVDRKSERGFAVEMFQIVGGTRVRLASQPCSRYSAKGLDAAVALALAEVRQRASEPAVMAVADPSSPA